MSDSGIVSPCRAGLGAVTGLADFAPQLAETFVSTGTDIALIIGTDGVIQHVAVGAEPISGSTAQWIGRPWAETVSGGTRAKIGELLAEAASAGVTRRRQVFHSTLDGQNVPISYSAIKLGPNGPVLAVGRDLGSVAAIKQQFLVAQRELEQDYWKRRHSESRYQQLFQVATDAVMVVDAETLAIVEANRAANDLFGGNRVNLIGQSATFGVLRFERPGVEELLVMARSSGRPGEIRVHATAPGGSDNPLHATVIDMSATPFRANDKMLLLVRARASKVSSEPSSATRLSDFVEQTPDAVTIADSSGRVLMANPAFVALCQLSSGTDAGKIVGRSLAELLGDPQNTLSSILAEAKSNGLSEQRPATIGLASASTFDVQVSAALLAEGDQECIGLTLRRIDQRTLGGTSGKSDYPVESELAVVVSDLVAQLGQTSLTDLVAEISDAAERHLIELALVQSNGDHQRAAEILGISSAALWQRVHDLGVGMLGHAQSTTPSLLN